MLTLFPDETIISKSTDGDVNLTTHRILYEYKEWGKSYNQSIMLEHITSCENLYTSHMWALSLGIICIVAGFITAAKIIGLAIGIILIAIYVNTKKNVIIISSPSTKMKIRVDGMKRELILDFINKIELAKNTRLLSVRR
jgi:hypothetical protein